MKFLTNGLIAIGVFLGISLVIGFEFLTDYFGSSFSPSETLVATLLGAAIALSGTLFGIYASVESERRRENEVDTQEVLSIFARLSGILNALIAEHRHLLDGDPRTFLYCGGEVRLKKPAHGFRRDFTFTDSERVTPLRLREAWLYNVINDAQGAIDSLYFLQDKREAAFTDLFNKLLSQEGVKIEGRQVSGNFDVRPTDIMELQDIEGHLRRLTRDSLPKIEEHHKNLINLIETKFGRRISYYTDPTVPGSLLAEDWQGQVQE